MKVGEERLGGEAEERHVADVWFEAFDILWLITMPLLN